MENQPEAQANVGQPVQHRPPRKPMSKKKRVGIFSIIALVVLLTSAHFIISSVTDPLKIVQAMDRAVTDQDAEAFFDEVDVNETALINKEEYLSYIHSSDWESMRIQLTEGFESEDGQKFDFSIYEYGGGKVFTVKEHPKVFGLYSTYDIEAIPNQVVASANVEDTSVSIEGETLKVKGVSEYQDLTLAYPGEYDVKGEAESEFGTFEYRGTLSVFPNELNESELMIDFPSNSYILNTNKEDAILFINGESTDKPLSAYPELGPFPVEEEVTVHAEWEDEDGKTHTTEKVDTQSNLWGSIPLYFEELEAEEVNVDREPDSNTYTKEDEDNSQGETIEKAEVEDFMLQFLGQSIDALNSKDFSIVEPYFSADGTGKAESRDFIESGRVESETLLDGKMLNLKEVDEGEYEVTMSETYEIDYSDGDYKEPTFEATYLLKEENGELKVDSFVEIN
ncbi:TcaA NTF2-like domain-containing protein [Halobacillus kuroshimensis]|uniref:TcaA NTF2-like domain-containing protein n=1 Tax=Halobacillus kuroshimensis TaxID=302481 RepID=UPI001FCFF623|nr:hypothetical protein [Halobacillus kuroshimensis]